MRSEDSLFCKIRVGVFLTTILIFLYIFYSDGANTNVGYGGFVSITTPTNELPNLLGKSDNGFYVSSGIDISSGRPLNSDTKFSLRQWAPGLPIFYGILIKTTPEYIPLGISVSIVQSVFWLLIIWLILKKSRNYTQLLVTFTFLTILLFSYPFKEWFFMSGVFYSESLSIAFFSLALLLTLDLKNKILNWRVFLIGILLATSAYLKGTFEFVGVIFIIIATITLIYTFSVNKLFRDSSRFDIKTDLKRLFLISIIFIIITTPWRIVSNHFLYPEDTNFSWTQVTSVYWGHRWMDTEWLLANNVDWFVDGRGNSACLLDLTLCEKIFKLEIPSGGSYGGGGYFTQDEFKRLAIKTYLRNPVELISQRYSPTISYWFFKNKLFQFNNLLSLFFLSTFIFSTFYILRFWRKNLVLSILFSSLVFGTLGPLLIQSIERRYFFPVQIVSAILFISVLTTTLTDFSKHTNLWKRFNAVHVQKFCNLFVFKHRK